MKKLISLVLCVLLVSWLPFALAAAQQEEGSAVDIVLLIDQSGSLWGTDSSSDPDGYRLDAAQMVIALLGRNGSRVAYVPFACQVFESADSEFQPINSEEDYRKKMEEVEKLRDNPKGANGENEGGTDFAEALAYAYNLLANREDDSNQPMIILLTDGELNFEEDGKTQKPYYVWSDESGSFEFERDKDGKVLKDLNVYTDRKARSNAQRYASDLLKNAVAKCKEKKYPVYTIALKATEGTEYYNSLNEISTRTGAEKTFAIGTGDTDAMKKLPAYFGNMLADRIGSSDLRELGAECIDSEKNIYEVKFVIPNDSVMEANLFVPKENISSPTLWDADGNKCSGKNSVMELTSDKFVLYKLNNPSPYGIWRLQFTKTKDTDEDISFNLMYNYDVTLRGNVAVKNQHQPSEQNPSFKRSDKLVFSAQFFDNRKGELSVDPRLYKYPNVKGDDTDDWCEMKATYVLYQKMGETQQRICNGDMDVGDAQFYKELDMKEIRKSEGGYNTLAAGEYEMYIRVEGCGLVRDMTIPFKLENTPPNQVEKISLSREVNGDTTESYEAVSETYPISQMIKDDDNDELTVSLKQTDGFNVITLEYDAKTKSIVSTPVQEGDQLASGTATGILTVSEANNTKSQPIEIPVVMEVTSGLDEYARQWKPRIEMKDPATSKTVGSDLIKNQEVQFELALLHAETDVVGTHDEVKNLKAKIKIVDKSSGYPHEADMVLNDNGLFTYTHTTGVHAGQWDVKITYYQKETNKAVEFADTSFSVKNNAPAINNAKNVPPTKYVIYYNPFNPMPGVLPALGEETKEKDRTLNLNAFFVDQDGEDLKYTATQNSQATPLSELLDIVKKDNDSTWVLKPKANGSTRFTVIAKDNDDAQSGAITFEVEVVDLTLMWMQRIIIVSTAVAIIVIMWMIIHQVRKPKFPRGHLGVREGSSDYDTTTYEFLPSKKPISLAAVVMADTAAKYGINANVLTNVEIVPVRAVNGSVGVRLKKKFNDVNISLSSHGVSTKKVIWTPGDVLTLSGKNNSTDAELNIYLFHDSTPVTTEPFDGGVNVFGANDESGDFGGFVSNGGYGSSTSYGSDSGFGSSATDGGDGGSDFTADQDSNDDTTLGF